MAQHRSEATNSGVWSEDEHDRFLLAIKQSPRGPWSVIAQAVGTRSVRQVQTHTQKYYEKILRRVRGLNKKRQPWARVEHRIDDDILAFCELMNDHTSKTVEACDLLGEQTKCTDDSGSASPVSTSSWEAMYIGASAWDPCVNMSEAGLPSLDEALDYLIDALGTESTSECIPNQQRDYQDIECGTSASS